ncbi:MAG TPA: YqfO family protein [Spirochaetota bacterium]|nr:YqfO family protein [Spirochaetota bacterium]HPI89245.1 YqfO family protein [Spirochaetota bacterium]HPR48595.1 YqfO family protein [Spirochaetota bacterium]
MYKLCFYVPETHVELVKNAVFESGAGRIGNYDSCAWQVRGEGQYRPLEGSNPFLGTLDRIERVPEYRVEMVCDDGFIKDAVRALRESHPYEEPAYDVWKLDEL